MSTYRFSFPTPIHFGPGVSSATSTFLKGAHTQRPLVVTDRGVASLPIFTSFLQQLTTAGLKVASFSEIWGNPVKGQVSAGVEAYNAHKADAIVGFGGGAALDVAKAMALMVNHPGDLFDYEDDKPGARPIDREIPMFVALPTTSGTGSEVGRSAVISDESTHLKKIIFSPRLLAQAVFADPELTVNLPAAITAATGLDALTHCVEAYLAKGYHPICDGIALEGIRLASASLAVATHEPQNIAARGDMMMSSMMGAIAFQKGLGLVHSCAHALSTVTDMHHGLANGIMINHALRHNLPSVPERFQNMATVVGLKDPSGAHFLDWLEALKAKLGIPNKLSEAKVKREQLAALADCAILDSCHQCNPRPCTREDFVKIFDEAF